MEVRPVGNGETAGDTAIVSSVSCRVYLQTLIPSESTRAGMRTRTKMELSSGERWASLPIDINECFGI
jgi:hypothetical protein